MTGRPGRPGSPANGDPFAPQWIPETDRPEWLGDDAMEPRYVAESAPGALSAPSGPQGGVAPGPGTPRPSLRRVIPRTLTARLVVGVVGLVAALVLVTGGGTYLALKHFLYQRLDQQLSETAIQNAGFFEHCIVRPTLGPGASLPCFNGPPPTQPEWVALLDARGEPFATVHGTNVTSLVLSPAQRAALVADPGRMLAVTANSTDLRVRAEPAGDGLVVVSGLSTQEITRTLHRLLLLEVLIGGSAVLLALLATWFGVRFSLRNLQRVTSTARDVAAELSPDGAGLDRRVPVTEQGTEVGQLAGSMNTLLAAVETQFAARLDSEQRMRQFLADASHELRTPLTSIRGYAELARMQRDSGGMEEDNLGRIESEGTRMSRLVDDLLTLARSDQGAAPERQLVDVAEVLDEVGSTARAAFPDRAISVSAAAGLHVVGDPDQLLRAVRNLVSNAAAHTSEAGPIEIRAGSEGDEVVIRVADGGPGLPPEDAAHVFERFWRADRARTRARGGSGLGLPIVSSIARAHGGTVSFESDVVGGSTVTVRLPAGTD